MTVDLSPAKRGGTYAVARACNALRQAPDTRALKRELIAGNPYMRIALANRGLVFAGGAIQAATRLGREELIAALEHNGYPGAAEAIALGTPPAEATRYIRGRRPRYDDDEGWDLQAFIGAGCPGLGGRRER